MTAGKVALVLAASRRIGRAGAESLATNGFDVVVCSRTEAEVAATVTTVEGLGVRASGIPPTSRTPVN